MKFSKKDMAVTFSYWECNGSVPIRPKVVVFDSRALPCSAEAIFCPLLAPEGQIARTHGLRVSS